MNSLLKEANLLCYGEHERWPCTYTRPLTLQSESHFLHCAKAGCMCPAPTDRRQNYRVHRRARSAALDLPAATALQRLDLPLTPKSDQAVLCDPVELVRLVAR